MFFRLITHTEQPLGGEGAPSGAKGRSWTVACPDKRPVEDLEPPLASLQIVAPEFSQLLVGLCKVGEKLLLVLGVDLDPLLEIGILDQRKVLRAWKEPNT